VNKTVILAAPSNWNTDEFTAGLDALGYKIILICLRRKSRVIQRHNLTIIRPILSFTLACFIHVIFRNLSVEIYRSSAYLKLFKLFDLESKLIIQVISIFRRIDIYMGWAGCCACTLKEKPGRLLNILFIGNSHIDQQNNARLRVLEKEILEGYLQRHKREYTLADLIITESEYSASTFRERLVTRVRCITIPVLYNFDKTTKNWPTEHEPLRVAVGSLRRIKGRDIVIEMVENISRMKNFLKIKIVVFDCGDPDCFSKYEFVQVKPRLPKSSFLDELAYCDILLLPTWEDGGPRLLAEASCMGLYHISSKYCKGPELEEHGLGRTCNSNSATDFISLLSSIDCSKLRLNRGSRALTGLKIFSEYDFKRSLDEVLTSEIV
jgi:hypothetical protein